MSRMCPTAARRRRRDLIGGQIDYLRNLGAAAPLIAGRQVKAIAVLSRALAVDARPASAHEQGLTDFDVTTWTAFFLPKGAPRAIVEKLNVVTHATMDTPAITSRMLEIGVTGVAPGAEARNTLQASSPTRLCGGKARSSQAGCRSIDRSTAFPLLSTQRQVVIAGLDTASSGLPELRLLILRNSGAPALQSASSS